MQLFDDELELAIVHWLVGKHLQFERLLEAMQYQRRTTSREATHRREMKNMRREERRKR